MSSEPNYPASFFARLFSLSERRIQQLAKQEVIPKAARGQYPLIGTIQGYVKYLQERSLGVEVGPGDLQTERVRLTKGNADKVELEVAILQGDLIPAETVAMVQTKMLGAFRAKCLSIPTKTAPRVVYLTDLAETEGELRNSIYDALSELSEFSPEQYGISLIREDSTDDSATTEPDG